MIVVLDPDPDFDIVVDDFEITYPNLQPYDSRDGDYYITAGWNEDIPNTFVIGDRRTTSAIRNGIMEEYFNAELENGQSYCFYVTAHVQSDIGGVSLPFSCIAFKLMLLVVCLFRIHSYATQNCCAVIHVSIMIEGVLLCSETNVTFLH